MTELHITRLSGFDRGKRVRFSESPVVLGTDATSSVRFDPTWDKTVSARHATLIFQGNAWILVDQSRDGCWINGQKISDQRTLEPLTEIELGRGGPKIKVEIEKPPVSAPSVPVPSRAIPASPERVHEPVHQHPPVVQSEAGNKTPLWMAVGALVLVLAGLVAFLTLRGRGSDEALAEMADKYAQAVGVVVIPTEGGPVPFGTAWAIGDHVLATNSHVAEPVGQILESGRDVFVVLNKNPDKKFRITKAVVHPLYDQGQTNTDGQSSAVPAFDVGLLVVKETLPIAFPLAPDGELGKLRSGYRIAYLGFPSEGLAGGGVDARNPVATMQSGIVTSVTDWWLGKADFDKALLVQHNLGATGGASGSPIFNTKGEVVALLSAGNIIGQVQVAPDGSTHVIRAPSAAMINFGQRADLLKEFIDQK